MSDLPKGWIKTKFTSFLDIQGGTQPPKSEFLDFPHDGYVRLLQIRDFSSDSKAVYIKNEPKWRQCNEEDILIGRYGASLGKILTGKAGVYNVALAKVVFSKHIVDIKFLFYLLKSEYFQIPLLSISRSAQNGFNKDDLDRIDLLLPPLAEQKRIVTKLDSLFAHTRRAREELDHIPKLIERYKQAILSAAFRGDLTADWRKENNYDIDKTWKPKTLGELIVNKPKNGYSAKPVKYQTPFRVLTLTATTSGKFNSEHFKYFDEPIDINSQFWLQPDDILIQRGNTIEYVGVSAIYDGLPNQFIFPDLMIRVRANSKVLTKFLHIALSCETSRNYLRDKATGTAGTMPKINQLTLISLPILVPPLEEQQEIVKRVEIYFQAIDRLEQEHQKAIKLGDRLEQTTLAKAFRGELVPQDPNDEPASVLLERIQKEREAQSLPKKKTKKTTPLGL